MTEDTAGTQEMLGALGALFQGLGMKSRRLSPVTYTALPVPSQDTWAEEPELSEARGSRGTAGQCASSVRGEPWALHTLCTLLASLP